MSDKALEAKVIGEHQRSSMLHLGGHNSLTTQVAK
jgi:hypothetical protein